MAKKDHLTEELNRHFGFGTFKGNQKAIIENVLAGKDTFVLMPTDRKSTRLNSSHPPESRMPSSA